MGTNDHLDEIEEGDESISNSTDSGWTSSRYNTSARSDSDVAKPAIGSKENRAVKRSKILVGLFLMVVAATAGGLTYKFTSKEEEDTFEKNFIAMAKEIMTVARINEEKLAEGTENIATSVTASALASNSTWPFVTIPFWEQKSVAARSVSGALTSTYCPLVQLDQREAWEEYAVENQGWINEDRAASGIDVPEEAPISSTITTLRPEGPPWIHDESPGPYCPIWQIFPYVGFYAMLNLRHSPISAALIDFVVETQQSALGDFRDLEAALDEASKHPTSIYYSPIFDTFDETRSVVAVMSNIVGWNIFLENILKEGEDDLVCVIKNVCGNQSITYEIRGPTATYVGEGDYHDPNFDYLEQATNFKQFDKTEAGSGETCSYTLHIYPSEALRLSYETNTPALFTTTVVFIFCLTSLVFILYDCLVTRRQNKVMSTAVRTDAIVSNLIPEQFRDQLYGNEEETKNNKQHGFHAEASKDRLKNFVAGFDEGLVRSKPVADLFPSATVMFADIVGFTSWSSVREPSQVFTLLETIYSGFDKTAKRRRVYKVETVGDSYVAVCGVPDACKDHAVRMSRFALECSMKLPEVFGKLERFLGPGTGDLSMRFGLHSGQVTAGVLRGERARFQLFGDTVNTAARLESSGMGNRIHVSEQTAKALLAAGKSKWVKPRKDTVLLKGLGQMKTYWLTSSATSQQDMDGTTRSSTTQTSSPVSAPGNHNSLAEQTGRLVEWNVEMLTQLLKQVVASRSATKKPKRNGEFSAGGRGNTAVDEVVEIIALPGFDTEREHVDPSQISLGPEVEEQLHRFVKQVAAGYNQNPFHNFNHASHVAMSVSKLLSRIVAPDVGMTGGDTQKKYASRLHDHTYGITSDPLTQLSIVLSALMHDIGHRGVPNGQLCQEDAALAAKYKSKSVAEQNSVDVGWNLLMTGDFEALRGCIYTSEAEFKRFRQVIVNNIMATDIFDKELSALRKKRWDRAFSSQIEEDAGDSINRKATIVIEHVLQASDVAHTMQHWHVYTKWNEKLYEEMYLAYKNGRAEKDPSEGWYGGELWFFDNYVIPLAKKLESCGVFGVSSDEYLSYALANRDEWEKKGKDIVAAMVAKHGGTTLPSLEKEPVEATKKVVVTEVWT